MCLGVIERVPVNTPSDWCSRMVTVVKKNGKPRRTVDFKAPRQTHAVDPPFIQAASVPPDTWKTTLDTWNGYHSIPLAPEDRHITTFLTPWGQYRSQVLPQRFLAANDG